MELYEDYEERSYNRPYKKLKDINGERLISTETLELIANFSFVPQTQKIIESKLAKYGIDCHEFSVHFDGATFEYFPKQLKVKIYIFQFCYSFDFTQPQHLGQPLSKNTDQMLLGKLSK